ncbi:MAG: sensor histidine kinase [Chloroflexota bacterium]
MLNHLRWQLTGLYVLAAAALIVLFGGAASGLLAYYFQSATDLALQYKVALAYRNAGLDIPDDLKIINQLWLARNPAEPTPKAQPKYETESQEDGDDDGDDDEHHMQPLPTVNATSHEEDEAYDSELSAVFLLPVDAQGQLLDNPNAFTPPLAPNPGAVVAAITHGSDFRTVWLQDGSRVRLFSYRVGPGDYFQASENPAVLQVGRSLKDQDRILIQLLVSMAVLGAISVVSVGVGSWWLAGRSVKPAQQAWDRQQSFVANASHELRTPLTVLRASAEVARRGLDVSDAHHTLLGDILQETDYMSRLVDDLLLLSRLDGGRLKLERQPVILPDLLAGLARQVGPLAAERNIFLEISPSTGVVLADPTRLRQVLLILFDNALHHTPDGGCIRLQAQPEGRLICLTVSDNGGGIALEHLPHVFERFYRGKEERRQYNSGSGLGLAIARSLVEGMHGQIAIASRPGQGTQVAVRLPIRVGPR